MTEFINQLANLSWRNVIDIALVAVIFYQILMWIKGTRAVQLVKGLLVLLAVSTTSDFFGFQTMSWMLAKVWTMLFVALPVVFQPELRRALEQIGNGRFLSMHPSSAGTEELKKMVEELIKCTQVLSQNQIGALIVLEKKTGIQEFVETGVIY